MEKTQHIPVLESEVLEYLQAAAGGNFLDCTLGGAGHTLAILQANPKNTVTASDRDERALKRAAVRLADHASRVTLLHADFAALSGLLKDQTFDGMLADLGISTDQLKENRGFSFNDDAALDMRMDESQGQSAADIVNGASAQQIFVLLKQGGVGNEARAIANAIVERRPYGTAKELAAVVNQTFARVARGKAAQKKVNPSTVVFQALRIAVNREFEHIESLMELAPRLIRSGGRIAIITFHSLEDRVVARKMREWESGGEFSARSPGSMRAKRLGHVVERKGIEPSAEEVTRNPSARSACLRVFEFSSIDS
ncbi:MAG: 16S rRNA (cytosine(1402)-N(4))-methyltransferase RsmH [Deltaproteobacteria bacterium]|nr:16S rRNA (cytosine(1402)-N(4))-methyltransferase RsmH [Deltaproteobacteria bacterium]